MFRFRSKLHFFVKLFDRTLWVTGKSLCVRARGSITAPNLHRIHHAPPLHQTFFLPTGCTIRSLLSGLESDGCEGSKKWALSHWIMPLFQLLWPGMPNFTARYSSLCVNQSFARGRGAHWVRLQPRVIRSGHWSPRNHTCPLCIFQHRPGSLSNFKNNFVFGYYFQTIIFIKFGFSAQFWTQIGTRSQKYVS